MTEFVRVAGYDLTSEQQQAAVAAMSASFKPGDVERALERAGLDDEPTRMRVAGDLIQRARFAGRIRSIDGHLWSASALL